jgi:uncharacterized protein (DUF2141 family)
MSGGVDRVLVGFVSKRPGQRREKPTSAGASAAPLGGAFAANAGQFSDPGVAPEATGSQHQSASRSMRTFSRESAQTWCAGMIRRNKNSPPRSDVSGGHASCEFPGIASGTYAVSVFHYENGNGKLDTNFMGMPREGVGASNDARGHFGPPKFAAAAFRFSSVRIDLKITINLNYL